MEVVPAVAMLSTLLAAASRAASSTDSTCLRTYRSQQPAWTSEEGGGGERQVEEESKRERARERKEIEDGDNEGRKGSHHKISHIFRQGLQNEQRNVIIANQVGRIRQDANSSSLNTDGRLLAHCDSRSGYWSRGGPDWAINRLKHALLQPQAGKAA